MALFRCSGASGPKVAVGFVTFNATTTSTITVGFKPKKLIIYPNIYNGIATCIYDQDISTTTMYTASNSQSQRNENLPCTSANRLNSITNTGFIMNKCGSTSNPYKGYYVAIG